jgi:two-component system OmpR family sensor kinase
VEIHYSFDRAEQVEKLLDCFQKALGHELPNQLVALQGLARLLEAEKGSQLDEEGRACLDRVASLAQRVGQLVRALADLDRLCRDPEPATAVSLAEAAGEAVAEVKVLYPGSLIEYHLQDRMPVVTLPRRALHQVLLQLLRNAAQAAVPSRPLRIDVGARTRSDGVVLWVADDGRGLTEMQMRQLFEPFAGSAGGMGLGLFLVRQLVAAWGGAVCVYSEPGQGARFRVLIPDTRQGGP